MSTRFQLGLSVVLMVGPGTAAAVADPPAIQITWSINGEIANLTLPAGVDQGAGSFIYTGTATDALTGIELSYDLIADPYSSLSGNLVMLNDLENSIDVSIQVTMPFTPIFLKGSQLSGAATIGLTTGLGGGQISSQPPALWQAVIDGAVVDSASWLFFDPFFMSNGGQGSSSTQQHFGTPVPVSGPPISTSLGFALNFSLTSLDLSSFTSVFTANGDALTCPGDLDIGGSVDAEDLLMLLANWGRCPAPCDGDLDGDGAVGILDLLALLAVWGPCQ